MQSLLQSGFRQAVLNAQEYTSAPPKPVLILHCHACYESNKKCERLTNGWVTFVKPREANSATLGEYLAVYHVRWLELQKQIYTYNFQPPAQFTKPNCCLQYHIIPLKKNSDLLFTETSYGFSKIMELIFMLPNLNHAMLHNQQQFILTPLL